MSYKFKSPASGDVVMLESHGNQLLRLLGREPAARGIIEPAAMAAALAALQAAIDTKPPPAVNAVAPGADAAAADGDGSTPVGLRQRLWPMIDMLRRAQAAQQPIVWGV